MPFERFTLCAGQQARAGQAYVETAVVIMLISFLFLGLFQLSQIFVSREMLHHAAHRAARARTVGFNRWMVEKSMRAAAIPNAGALLEPGWDRGDATPLRRALAMRTPGGLWDFALTAWPASQQAAVERARIPQYLASVNRARAAYILDYADWDTLSVSHQGATVPGAGLTPSTFETIVTQRLPLRMAMHRAFYAPEPDADGQAHIALSGRVRIENHASLYLNDQNW